MVGSRATGRPATVTTGRARCASTSSWHAATTVAYSAIKEIAGPEARVGLTHVFPWIHPAEKGGAFSEPLQAYWRWLVADHFLAKVRSSLDWLGVQYYYDSPVTHLPAGR